MDRFVVRRPQAKAAQQPMHAGADSVHHQIDNPPPSDPKAKSPATVPISKAALGKENNVIAAI